jgi:hypothetical protein
MVPLTAPGAEVPVNFVRRFVKLRNAIHLNHLAEFMDQDTEQLLRILLSADGVCDPN